MEIKSFTISYSPHVHNYDTRMEVSLVLEDGREYRKQEIIPNNHFIDVWSRVIDFVKRDVQDLFENNCEVERVTT